MKSPLNSIVQLILSLTLIFIFPLFSISQGNYQVIVLGTSQDGGYPQLGCSKVCCQSVWTGENTGHYVSSIAVIDLLKGEYFLIDCTPDFPGQMQLLRNHFGGKDLSLKGIFLTHAHIGHYLGLAQFGKEVMAAKEVPVYTMPRMKTFLEGNGPWKQLVEQKNIAIRPISAGTAVSFGELKFTPVAVPHRDEFSETVAYEINSGEKSMLYLPDIDFWSKWDRSITKEAERFDFILIDGTFYDANELSGRNQSEVPHPTVTETMSLFSQFNEEVKQKVFFTHMNHSNPLHFEKSDAFIYLTGAGFNVAQQGQVISLKKP